VGGNYNIDNLDERVAAAMIRHKDYVASSLQRYAERVRWRRQNGLPTLALLGMGRAGKDTAAAYLGDTTPLKYAGSSSNRLVKFASHVAGVSEEEAFATRHQHRPFWVAVGHAVRGQDLTLLARINLGHGDMAVGLRGRHEVYGCKKDGVIDLAVWIDNPRAADDVTVEFTAGDCDVSILNHGSHSEFYRKLDSLAHVLRMPARGRNEEVSRCPIQAGNTEET
jgi:hypothetical protein